MAWANNVVRVRVPATSANLGPGFDALGLALSLHDDVDAWVCESGLSIEISGEGADLAGVGEDHLVVRAMRAAFAVIGEPAAGHRAALREPDPARPRPRLLGRRDRGRHPGRAGPGRSWPARRGRHGAARPTTARWQTMRCSGSPLNSRAIRTTWPPAWAAG